MTRLPATGTPYGCGAPSMMRGPDHHENADPLFAFIQSECEYVEGANPCVAVGTS